MSFYDDASWVLIPEGIKEDVVYAQKPTDGLGDLTFTRASDATRTNSAGVIERTPWNLVTFSEQFDNAAWSKSTGGTSTVTVTANAGIAPNGTNTAERIQLTRDAAGFAQVIQTVGALANQSYTFSVYLKSLSGTPRVMFGSFGGTNAQTAVLTNEWVRYTWTATAPSTSAFAMLMIWGGIASTSLSADFLAWGYQLVEGTDAKPYFATTNRQDVPRLDYRNADGSLNSCPRLLLEPQRTNLSLWSEDFDNATWIKDASFVTANTTTSPSGFTNADTYSGNGGGALSRFIYQSQSFVSGTQYTISIYAKKNTNNFIQITGGTAVFGVTAFANFDLDNGVLGTVGTTATARIENAGNGWYRCSMTAAAISTTTSAGAVYCLITSATAARVAPNTLSTSVFIWGAQVEAGAYATTFIPTTTAAVTRLADSASKTGVSSLIGQTEGTLFVDMNLLVRSGNAYFALAPNLGLTSNYIGISFSATNIQAEMVSSSVAQAAIQFVNSATGNFKIAFAYKQNDLAFYVNGVLVGTDTNATVPVCSQIGLFNYFQTMALQYNQAALFPTRLTNAQLAQLTT